MENYLGSTDFRAIIKSALSEDIGEGDHTSLACIKPDAISSAKLLIKDEGILAGVEIAKEIFYQVDSSVKVNILINDGSKIQRNDIAFHVEGSARSILTAERTVLNFMQRMSGIATYTNKAVNLIKGNKARILDTRKTTPNFRYFEKLAVTIGGAFNHRYGLFDMILIKDNHVDYAGGIENAINSANEYLKKNNKNLKIEIETRNLEEVKKVMSIGKVNRIMLDNFSADDMRLAVKLIDGNFETEASGGINLDNIKEYASTGVDFISLGALTHQIKSLDMSLKANKG